MHEIRDEDWGPLREEFVLLGEMLRESSPKSEEEEVAVVATPE